MLKRMVMVGACATALMLGLPAAAADNAANPAAEAVIKVEGLEISRADFEAAVARNARQKFYHGKVDDQKLAELKQEVAQELILDRLLAKEVERRKVKPDEAEVEKRVRDYDERYKGSEQWARQRDAVLPQLKARLLENSRRAVLEKTVRDVPPPSAAELEKFHKDNPKLFTEPQRDHVAVILLKVDPSSTKDVWLEAQAEAARIRAKVVAGQDFGDLAKLHSADESAAKGGDMGYLHHGMLAPEAQAAVDKLQPGQVTEPVELLQGYGLLKLIDRAPATLRTLPEVRERAADLYRRQKGDAAWAAFVDQLKKKANAWVSPTIAEIPPAR